jgi:hypothetical protein
MSAFPANDAPTVKQSVREAPVVDPGPHDHAHLGRVLRTTANGIIFQPRGTSYEMQLACSNFRGEIGKPTRGTVRVVGRKLYTVASGGAFVVPIMGETRIVQGRVIDVRESTGGRQIVLQAGATVVVDLPEESSAIDLGHGPIGGGAMVNVVCLPGAWFEPA